MPTMWHGATCRWCVENINDNEDENENCNECHPDKAKRRGISQSFMLSPSARSLTMFGMTQDTEQNNEIYEL